MAESGIKSYFPSQTVSDAEKLSYDYGLKVGKAIEQEWFNNDRSVNRYRSNHNDFHNLRLYARGEQSIQKYKDELSINGDLSYLHMQLTYKQSIEIAEEQAINTLMEGSRYELIKKQFYYDLTVLGIGAVKTSFNTSEGVVIDYVDPANLVYSYTESPYFEDIYYVGEVKTIPVNELAKQFPHLSGEDLEDIMKNKSTNRSNYNSIHTYDKEDNNTIQVLYFNWKTYMNEVYKIKETSTGSEKALTKDDSFNPPQEKEGGYTRMLRSIECLYDGAMILGTNKLLRWEMAKKHDAP
jgi:hypothetical protein